MERKRRAAALSLKRLWLGLFVIGAVATGWALRARPALTETTLEDAARVERLVLAAERADEGPARDAAWRSVGALAAPTLAGLVRRRAGPVAGDDAATRRLIDYRIATVSVALARATPERDRSRAGRLDEAGRALEAFLAADAGWFEYGARATMQRAVVLAAGGRHDDAMTLFGRFSGGAAYHLADPDAQAAALEFEGRIALEARFREARLERGRGRPVEAIGIVDRMVRRFGERARSFASPYWALALRERERAKADVAAAGAPAPPPAPALLPLPPPEPDPVERFRRGW